MSVLIPRKIRRKHLCTNGMSQTRISNGSISIMHQVNNVHVLVVVDAKFIWPEIVTNRSNPTQSTIKFLETIFLRNRSPAVIVILRLFLKVL